MNNNFLVPNITFLCHISDIELHSSVGIGDSLHNLQLLIEFCAAQHLPERVLHLTINDLFHSHHDLKPNLLVFLAEMFHQFEVVRPECVTGDGEYSRTYLVSVAYLSSKVTSRHQSAPRK